MQPLLNLKSFLAVLLVLAVPGALLVAYFRNYDPEAGRHEHAADGASGGTGHGRDKGGKSEGKSGDFPMKGHGDMSSAQKSDMPASMGHEGMRSTTPAQPAMEESGPAAVMHIGAKGFFLDRPQTFTPRADQAKTLNEIKERSAMEMMTADKKLQEAEQHLWKLTASERPDIAGIEANVREVEKLRADQRILFIRSVSEAANVLTAEQKGILLRSRDSSKPETNTRARPSKKSEEKAEPAHKH